MKATHAKKPHEVAFLSWLLVSLGLLLTLKLTDPIGNLFFFEFLPVKKALV